MAIFRIDRRKSVIRGQWKIKKREEAGAKPYNGVAGAGPAALGSFRASRGGGKADRGLEKGVGLDGLVTGVSS